MCRGRVPASSIACLRSISRWIWPYGRPVITPRRSARGGCMPPTTNAEPRAYPRPLPNPEWLDKLREDILEPELPIVDPPLHLGDPPGSHSLPDELLADVNSGHNIVATVFIQCGSGYRTSGPEEMRC